MKIIFKRVAFTVIAVLLPFVAANEVIRWVWFNNYFLNRILRRDDWDLCVSLRRNLHARLPVGALAPKAWKGKNAFWELNTNSQGIRAQEPVGPKGKGVFRIICIGDSITFGLDVDDRFTYPSQLEQILNQLPESAGKKIEVINAGVPTYTTRQGLIYLDERLLQFQPDLVIAAFGGNDARPISATFFSRTDQQFMKGDTNAGFGKLYQSPFNWIYFEFHNQPLIVALKQTYVRLIGTARLNAPVDKAGYKKESDKNPSLSSPVFQRVRVPPQDLIDNLDQMAELANKNGFRMMFYIPYLVHPMYRFWILEKAKEKNIPVADFSTKFWEYQFSDLLADPTYAQLLSPYQQSLGDNFLAGNPQYLLTTDGSHPNNVGDRIVAEEIARTIIASRLLDSGK